MAQQKPIKAKGGKKVFDPTDSGTLNAVQNSDGLIRGKINVGGMNYNLNGAKEETKKGPVLNFSFTTIDASQTFGDVKLHGQGYLKMNVGRSTEKAPTWRGKATVSGVDVRISGWNKESPNGRFISLSVQTEASYQEWLKANQGSQEDAPVAEEATVGADEVDV